MENNLRPILLAIVLCTLLPWAVLATPLEAQQETTRASTGAEAFLEAGASLARIHGEFAPVFHAAALVRLTSHLAVGGGGTILMTDPAVADVIFADPRLGFGFGGLIVEYSAPTPGGKAWVARVLAGAGNADLVDTVTGVRVASDNVFVVEPKLEWRLRLNGKLGAALTASYRVIWGVQDLADLTRGDLGGLSLGGTLRLGPL